MIPVSLIFNFYFCITLDYFLVVFYVRYCYKISGCTLALFVEGSVRVSEFVYDLHKQCSKFSMVCVICQLAPGKRSGASIKIFVWGR